MVHLLAGYGFLVQRGEIQLCRNCKGVILGIKLHGLTVAGLVPLPPQNF